MDSTVIDNNIIDFEWYDEEDSSVLMAAESPWRGFAVELQDLHYLKGASFINQLKLIINSGELSMAIVYICCPIPRVFAPLTSYLCVKEF